MLSEPGKHKRASSPEAAVRLAAELTLQALDNFSPAQLGRALRFAQLLVESPVVASRFGQRVCCSLVSLVTC